MRTLILSFLVLAGAFGQEPARDWPQWRGPRADGISTEAGWTATFTADGPTKLWEAKLGRGHSSVVIRQGKLYTFSIAGENTSSETVWCLNADTGKEIWKHTYAIESLKRGTNPAGGTPTLVDGVLYSYGAAMNLLALEATSGKVLWSRDLMKDLPGQPVPYGYQISPVVQGDLVIVAAITARAPVRTEPRGGPYAPTGGVLLGLDRKTGKEIWRNTEGASSWSTPLLTTLEGKPTLVHHTGKLLIAVDPSTGKTRWKYDPTRDGFKPLDVAAAPLVVGDRIIFPIHDGPGARAPAGYSTLCLRIKNDRPELAWKTAEWAHWFQSGVVHQGHVYGFDEKSAFSCLDVETGATKWRSRDFGPTGSNGGGFLLADCKVLAIDARGQLTIAEVSPTGGKVLSQARVLEAQGGYQCETAPVLLDGRLYCRNHTQLLCFDLRARKP